MPWGVAQFRFDYVFLVSVLVFLDIGIGTGIGLDFLISGDCYLGVSLCFDAMIFPRRHFLARCLLGIFVRGVWVCALGDGLFRDCRFFNVFRLRI